MVVQICIIFFFVFLYFGFIWKINWIQDLTHQNSKSSARCRMSKSRKIGRLPPVYPNGWFGLLDSLALRKGQVKHVAALGQNFAVFRTKSGAVRILDTYCPHLGANMAEGGRVVGEELECPFHLWRFCGESGQCTSIPYTEKIPINARTKVWECTEANGVIFVWYHAESASPSWWPKPIEKIADGSWKYQGRNEFHFNCHIQEIPENGADWAHLNSLHGQFIITNGLLSKLVKHTWTDASWSAHCNEDFSNETDKRQSNKEQRHRATSFLKHELVLFDKYKILKLNVVANQIGPGYVELFLDSSLGPLLIVQTVTPVQPLTQRVTHLIFSPMLLAPYARMIFVGECLQFVRDAKIWSHKKYVDNPILIKEEKSINAYRRWYKQFYTENSPTYDSCRESLDW